MEQLLDLFEFLPAVAPLLIGDHFRLTLDLLPTLLRLHLLTSLTNTNNTTTGRKTK